MTNFYIKKLIVTGKNKEPSIIEFDKGLNIICGPSNTGKSYIVECIDYIFGGNTIPIDEKEGYDCVKMTVETERGTVTAERVFKTNKLYVTSSDPLIESGTYGIRSGNPNANTDLWLRLIGIEGHHSVIYNKTFDKKNLTWRYLLHMFLISEERIIQRSSILLPNQNTATTGTLSSLFFLITGKDFAETDPQEEKKIRRVKKAAVANYIRSQLASLSERKNELDNTETTDSIDLHSQVEDIIDEIESTEAEIADTARRNKALLREIYSLNEKLTECDTLHARYQSLRSQYHSDIERLTFIFEGEKDIALYPANAKCPFCDGRIKLQNVPDYTEAAHAELHRIRLQVRDLEEAESELVYECNELEERISALNTEKAEVDDILNDELKPKSAELKRTLSEYRKAMEVQDEFHFINNLETSMKSELFETEMEDDETVIEFNIKSRFDRAIMDNLDERIESVLRSCKYEGLGSARLKPSNFDVVINEKDKSLFGKGYRAFLNTVLSLSLLGYLTERGCYSPGLLIVDSPILSLKERVDDEASDSMKVALFRYMRNNQENGQIIVVENDVPDMDYGDKTRIIRFTKDHEKGRYGFLNTVC